MTSVIYNPLEEYEKKLREIHSNAKDIFAWPTKKIVAAKNGYTTRIPFIASKEIKEQAKGVFF